MEKSDEIILKKVMSRQTDIQKHITQTYINLRIGISVMALLLPVILFFGAWISDNFEAQGSISAYYHTPLRNLFVGILISIGSFLYLYKGFSEKENFALNIAGALAIGIALLPTRIPEEIVNNYPDLLPPEPFTAYVPHVICAFSFFAAIAYVCIYRSDDTVQLIQDPSTQKRYRNLYRAYGTLMIGLPLFAGVLSLLAVREFAIFIVEFVAVWVFAAFWLTKSREVKRQSQTLEYEIMTMS